MSKFIVPIKPKPNDSSNVTAIILASHSNPKMKTMPQVSVMMVDRQHTVLDIQIESIRTVFPKCEIIVVVGHDAQHVIEKVPSNVRIVEHVLHATTGELEEARLAINNVTTDNILLIDGSCIFNSAALKHMRGKGSCTLVDNRNQIEKESLGVISSSDVVENIAYGVQDKWCYITYLESKEHSILRKYVGQKSKGNLCLHEGINHVVSHGGKIYTVKQRDGYLRKITGGKDLI